MTDTVLVPLALPVPGAVSPALVSDLPSVDVVVLGHYQLPEQTPKESARKEFDADAEARLREVAAQFSEVGASVRTRLVFGKDRPTAIDRVAEEEGCVAELVPVPTDGIDRILVPIPDVPEFERLPRFVDALCEDSTREITLVHAIEGGESEEHGASVVDRTRDGMIDAGFDPSRIDTRTTVADSHDDEIPRIAERYDAVVMDEAESRLRDHRFGTLPDRIANRSSNPVIVVRRDYCTVFPTRARTPPDPPVPGGRARFRSLAIGRRSRSCRE